LKWAKVIIAALLLSLLALWWASNILDGRFLLSVPIVVILIVYLTPANNGIKALAGMIMLLTYLTCSQTGAGSYHEAYNECVQKGEEVRAQLSKFYEINQQYPEQLNQIASFNACKPILHSSILNYQKTASGYTLSFDDGFVEHRATESAEFMAHK
jgi:hypothetical protein